MKLQNIERLCEHCNKFGLQTLNERNPVNCYAGMTDKQIDVFHSEDKKFMICKYCGAQYK